MFHISEKGAVVGLNFTGNVATKLILAASAAVS